MDIYRRLLIKRTIIKTYRIHIRAEKIQISGIILTKPGAMSGVEIAHQELADLRQLIHILNDAFLGLHQAFDFTALTRQYPVRTAIACTAAAPDLIDHDLITIYAILACQIAALVHLDLLHRA